MVRTMAPKCRPDVAAARAQTERMLKEAEKAIGAMPSVHAKPQLTGPKEFTQKGPRSAEHCAPRLESARAVFAAAGENSDPLAQRDGYVRAAYQAGQALSCARVTQIGKKLGRMPTPKMKKKKGEE
jgi:hypothetical protein